MTNNFSNTLKKTLFLAHFWSKMFFPKNLKGQRKGRTDPIL